MVVCKTCKKEMRCETNGIQCRWRGTHVYAGDEFVCPSCGAKVVVCNKKPHYSQDFSHPELDVFMDDYDKKFQKESNINFRRKT